MHGVAQFKPLGRNKIMSRSYHVTEKKARIAFSEGDVQLAYQASEKSWVKREQQRARQQQKGTTNRSIVSNEATRTKQVKKQNNEL